MSERKKEETYLINLITNPRHKLEVENACEIVKKIWTSEVRIVREYTDHGYEHSQRIIQKLYEIIQPNPQILTETELYFLLLGAYLHDIGMQCDIKKYKEIKNLAVNTYSASFNLELQEGTANSYSVEEQNEIRRNHHLLTGAWIEYSQKNNTILSPFVNMIDPSYLDDLIKICIYHSKLQISDCTEKSKLTSIRTRLVAALLRFVDELDIDASRVHIETMAAFGYKTENAVFWYLHSRTKVTIKDSAVTVTVFLNQNDYNNYASCIDKIYIQNFKLKNKILTDIISQNKINVFISECSEVAIDRFQQDLPQEVATTLKTMYKDQLRAESKDSIELLLSMSADENQEEILNMLLGKPDNLNFMQKYKNNFITNAQNLKSLIDELKTSYFISETSVENAITTINSLRYGVKPGIFTDNEDAFTNSYKIFLFVKAFTTEQLTYLSDIGIKIPCQVSSGQALPYANNFFNFYFKYKSNPDLLEKIIKARDLFNYYTFEQIERILRSYNKIINFSTNHIEFSNSYVYPSLSYGKLLAASIYGESNKILIWDIENKKREPIASLGGLFEPVNNIKIYRLDNQVIITAAGIRQIYFWNLNLNNGEPIYIIKSIKPISDYLIYRSINGILYCMGLVERNIFIWELYKEEQPITCIPAGNDVFMVNTHLSTAEPAYECLGLHSYSDNEEPGIIELVEVSALSFNHVLRLEIYKHIDISKRSADGYANRLNSYFIDSQGKEIFLLINNDIYIGDLCSSNMIKLANLESQRILHVVSKTINNQLYLLTYSIYQQYRNSVDLIHLYKLENKQIVEHQNWLCEKKDIAYAAFSAADQNPQIYFAHLFDNKINKLLFDPNSYSEFYTIPDTFSLKCLTSE